MFQVNAKTVEIRDTLLNIAEKNNWGVGANWTPEHLWIIIRDEDVIGIVNESSDHETCPIEKAIDIFMRPQPGPTLVLTCLEADVLYAILRRVAGCPNRSLRGASNSIKEKLLAAFTPMILENVLVGDLEFMEQTNDS